MSTSYRICRGGRWEWDDRTNGLIFTREHRSEAPPMRFSLPCKERRISSTRASRGTDVLFRDMFNASDHLKFRRMFQRRSKFNEPTVVTLQDVKNVVLFQAVMELPRCFIKFFHTVEMDRFLRSLIVYFHLYLQTYADLVVNRDDTKLCRESLTPAERRLQKHLADVRRIVASFYTPLILGGGGMAEFHHFSSGFLSESRRDARLMEMTYQFALRVVWIALNRRGYNHMDAEFNRLFRSDHYNSALRRKDTTTRPRERLILNGEKTVEVRNKYVLRSPILSEAACKDCDFSLLCIGYGDDNAKLRPLQYLQLACLLPEEELAAKGISAGILGMQRSLFDALLFYEHKDRDSSVSSFDTDYGTNEGRSSMLLPPIYSRMELTDFSCNIDIPSTFPRSSIILSDVHAKQRQASMDNWLTHKSF